ncbi:hypothetical protein [Anabaena azotica]|uniref:Uncharacterized protein n=1 Tax=Anabaena azotica FACHB-119 TaxID=947527 RepID=A0ABR8DC03_9NOST|nr:hypothetical protein [Anabaena azotica]MBD2503885.1 hypothetical protein [Anabaena azotica FACHB-119]
MDSNLTAADKCLFILSNTNDGEKLSPRHLTLIQLVVNNLANEAGLNELQRVYEMVNNNNYTDWFYGIENLKKDHQGYIYWRNKYIEHFSYKDDYEGERLAAEKLASRCKHLESIGVEIDIDSVVFRWEEYESIQSTVN